jgi:uncharacterized membrane protein YgcG
MKNIRFLTFVLVLGTLLLSACGAAAATPTSAPAAGNAKVQAMPVAFVGIIDSMAGDQWVISGTTVTVDASIVRDGPFNVGDQVKVEGHVSSDGSFTVSRVEAPAPQDAATQPPLVDDNSNDANINDDHGVDTNVNDDNGGAGNTNDDNSNVSSPSNSNTNDDHGGTSSGGGNDNGGSGKGSGGGNDNGGNSNDG